MRLREEDERIVLETVVRDKKIAMPMVASWVPLQSRSRLHVAFVERAERLQLAAVGMDECERGRKGCMNIPRLASGSVPHAQNICCQHAVLLARRAGPDCARPGLKVA